MTNPTLTYMREMLRDNRVTITEFELKALENNYAALERRAQRAEEHEQALQEMLQKDMRDMW